MAATWDELMVSSSEDSTEHVISTVLGEDEETSLSSFGDGPFSPDADAVLENFSQETPILGVRRKSDRERRERRSFSPETLKQLNKGRRRKGIPRKLASTEKFKDGEKVCDLCLSSSLPKIRGGTSKKLNHKQMWKTKVDPDTGKLLYLCSTCLPTFDRQPRERKSKPPPPVEEKEKYLADAQTFADSLVQELGDQDADRLACPHFKNRGCGCLQRYILGDGNTNESRKRASQLLDLLKRAKQLSHKKFYDPDVLTAVVGKSKRSRNIGLGNGQKRSKEFEDFVLENRQMLRDTLMLCERATQRVLMYSNNFLHKKLKTESRSCRVERKKGKLAMGLLKPIGSLVKETCCADRCVRMSVTLSGLLEEWRERAAAGQMEARRVIAEMLTPSGGARANCYKFIEMVTGCSFSTIGKVNDQMRKSGGVREPPAHGMCKYWEKNPHKKKTRGNVTQHIPTVEDNEQEDGNADSFAGSEPVGTTKVTTVAIESPHSSTEAVSATLVLEQFQNQTNVPETIIETPMDTTDVPVTIIPQEKAQMVAHKHQIMSLQKQLAQQQIQLQQQQQLIQQQLLHQVLLDQTNTGSSGIHLQTLQSLQQLLSLQQQYQQQQLQQLNQLQEQAGLMVTPAETFQPSQNSQIAGGLETLQLQQPSQNISQLLQTNADQTGQDDTAHVPQSVVMLQSADNQQHVLQQTLTLPAQGSSEAMTAVSIPSVVGGPQQIPESVTTVTSCDAIVSETAKGSSIESLVQIPMPGSSGSSVILPTSAFCKPNDGTATTAQTLIPQVIDLGHLNVGLHSINTSQGGQILGNDTSQLLSNYNITLLPPQSSTSSTSVTGTPMVSTIATSTDGSELTANNTNSIWSTDNETLTQLLASSLGCTVLTIEPIDGSVLNQADVTSNDKATTGESAMYIDLDTSANNSLNTTNEAHKGGDKNISSVKDSGGDSVDPAQGEMSTAEVLQLLAQSGITIVKSDSETENV